MVDLPETFVSGFHDEAEVRKMTYNYLGDTGLRISELSLGTGGFSYFYGDYNFDECKATVRAAIKSGINYIDTGPWYGHGEAEDILGKCLEGIPRKSFYLATKVGRYEKDPKLMFDFSSKKTRDSIGASLQRLRLDYVDILQVHDIEFAPNLEVIINETLPTVQEIVMSGKARFIGITGYPVSKLMECLEKSNVKIDMILSYCRFTMIDNTLGAFIPQLKSKKVGIVNAAPNSMGLLSNNGPPQWHPACQEIKDICIEASRICKKHDVELGKLAVYWSLQQDGIDTVLVGMNSRQLLAYNLSVRQGLSMNEQKALEHVLKTFEKLTVKHWENFELENYKSILKGGGVSEAGFFK